jgi:hypothetical protein
VSSIAEGLVEGGAPPTDPFEAALEAKGVTGGGSSASPSIADGLTFAGTQDPPEPDTTGEPAVEEGTTPDEGGAEPLHEDPDIAAYLERFGGDPDKALRAAVEAQKQIGKQGNELGELRQAVAKLEGRIDQAAVQPQVAPPQIQMSSEEIENMVVEHGGLQAATWAANNAPNLLDGILRTWGADEAYDAAVFRQEYLAWKTEQDAAAAAPLTPTVSQTEEYVKNELEGRRMQASLDAVAQDYESFDDFKELLSDALAASPKLVQKAVVSSDDDEQREALVLVFDRAQAMSQAALKVEAAAVAKTKATVGKKAAQVITGSLRPATQVTASGDGQTTRQEEEARFKAAILAADTTSISEGLTYGKTP